MPGKTTADLRDTLFDAIEGVMNRRITPEQAREVANLSSEMVKTAKLEIEFELAANKIAESDREFNSSPMMLTHEPEPEVVAHD